MTRWRIVLPLVAYSLVLAGLITALYLRPHPPRYSFTTSSHRFPLPHMGGDLPYREWGTDNGELLIRFYEWSQDIDVEVCGVLVWSTPTLWDRWWAWVERWRAR